MDKENFEQEKDNLSLEEATSENKELEADGIQSALEAGEDQSVDMPTVESEIPEGGYKVIGRTPPKWIREMLEWSETLVVAVVFVVFLFTFVTRTSQVFGSSMVPTLHEGDVLMVTRLVGDYKYGDIVVITKPNYFNEPIIKRIIATEGQTVNIDFERNIVYVDGVALEEEYINEPTRDSYDVQFPVEVPKGMVFVMGDNRNASLDSRSTEIGMVDERYILGKAYLRVAPFADFGGLYGK